MTCPNLLVRDVLLICAFRNDVLHVSVFSKTLTVDIMVPADMPHLNAKEALC